MKTMRPSDFCATADGPCPVEKVTRVWLTAGPVLGATWPPREVQPNHEDVVPFKTFCQTAPSVPRTKTQILFAGGYGTLMSNVAAGDAVSFLRDFASRTTRRRIPFMIQGAVHTFHKNVETTC